MDRSELRKRRRWVVKIGSGVLAPGGRFDRAHHRALAEALLELRNDRELIVVSSGAIALGVEHLGWKQKPRDVPKKQAAAAVGQSRLMAAWAEVLAPAKVGQVLLTHDVLADRRRFLHARRTFAELLAAGAIPVVNENDTVAVDEIRFGDNDALAALVVQVTDADALLILSDVEALYDADPRSVKSAKPLRTVAKITAEHEAAAGGAGSAVGTGGMATKLQAAKRATALGAVCLIASGRDASTPRRVIAGDEVGTLFLPRGDALRGRKRWVAQAARPRGVIHVDEGAVRALVVGKKSLLASGVKAVSGSFTPGDVVEIHGPGGLIARGLTRYRSDEVARIAGRKTAELEKALGYRDSGEVVHRDDLVLT